MLRLIVMVALSLIALSSLTAHAAANLVLSSPTPRAVIQRGADNAAKVTIAGTCEAGVTAISARAVLMSGGKGAGTEWKLVAKPRADGSFRGRLVVPAGGWYRIEVRVLQGEGIVAEGAVERVGVGEVFITAGQSNAENFGNPSQKPSDDRVSSWNPATGAWQFAVDPQPGFPGAFVKFNDQGGSPWPALGEALVRDLGVPIGFVMCGDGGTAVSQWLPGGGLYARIRVAVRTFGRGGGRAILWHQGESDTSSGTPASVYAQRLQAVIDASRKDARWEVPWVIAIVAYNNHREFLANEAGVRAGQQAVCNGKSVFVGPTTDDLVDGYRWDGIHMNDKGLREHGRRWRDKLAAIFFAGQVKQ
jgi:eukaryotic-like serine/threonine-protein kinase